MNFSEVLTEVLRIVARPDKSVDAAIAINRAVSYCTLKGSFRKDLVEASIAINPTLYGDTISLASLTRFRRFTYVKLTGTKYYLKPISEEQVFTPKNQMQPNVYYVAGTSLTYTLSSLAASLEVGYLSYPIVLDAVTNPAHWMLDIMPYAIIDLAAARLFADVGDDVSANRFERTGMDSFLAVRRDFALGD